MRKRAILSRPGGNGRACPSLKSLEQKRDCSSRCQKPKLKFGSWSACKTGKSRYPSATCPGIQSRKIVCSTSDDTEFPIHKCLSPGQSLPMSRRKCINYCKANRKVSQFFQKYDIQNKNMISMIIPTPGPKQSDITVREVGEWSSCFLDDQQTCGTGRKYRTKACLSLDGSPLPLSFCQETESKFLQVCSIECKSLTVSTSSWTLWSPCSRSCGNGVQTRFIRSAGIHLYDLPFYLYYVVQNESW